jgi:hypothetical protein
MELVVDSLFKVCTCVAVDGTKRAGPNSGKMSAVDVTADIVQRRTDIR